MSRQNLTYRREARLLCKLLARTLTIFQYVARNLNTLGADAVTLAAIQGLYQLVQERGAQLNSVDPEQQQRVRS